MKSLSRQINGAILVIPQDTMNRRARGGESGTQEREPNGAQKGKPSGTKWSLVGRVSTFHLLRELVSNHVEAY